MKKFFYSIKVAPFIFICPFVLTVMIFWLLPVGKSVLMSFQNVLPGEVKWIGLHNYVKLFNDRIFMIAVRNTFTFTIGMLLLLIPIPMILACIVDSKIMKYTKAFKTVYFVPALTSVVVAGTIFRLIFGESNSALMNEVIHFFGMQSIKWLKLRTTGYFALFVLACWRWTGVNMMYYIAGLQNIPKDLYESASIDGANSFQKLLKISIPLLKPTTTYVLTISINAGLSMFNESYMLWKGNNSPSNIGLTIVGYLYRQGIEKNAMGYASAVGVLLLVIVLGINIVQLWLSGFFKKEAY
jgi:arabinosaccharide transport system permease protein